MGISVSHPIVNFIEALLTTLPTREQEESHKIILNGLGDLMVVKGGKEPMARLGSIGLDLYLMRGQCYDGPGTYQAGVQGHHLINIQNDSWL